MDFSASGARKKLDITSSSVQIEEYQSVSPSTQEYQILEGKLKQDPTDRGAIGERSGRDQGKNTGIAQLSLAVVRNNQ